MPGYIFSSSRRDFLRLLSSLSGLIVAGPALTATNTPLITRRIPSTDELLPAIGMGSWQTFDVSGDSRAVATRVEILRTFFARGGRLIDSSPMYGHSEEVIGQCLQQLDGVSKLFSATKVWVRGRWLGIRQMETSRKLWGVKQFDLMQVHNLVDWQVHMATLKEWKQEGRIRYLGITTSHGRRHAELERIMLNESLDFVQFTYNILDREAEQRLLPIAAEKGIAVIINRPFQGGRLFEYVRTRSLPAWTKTFDCDNWAQFFLKFIISHPHVTCTIPATSQITHMQENMGACYGKLPDADMRRKMSKYIKQVI